MQLNFNIFKVILKLIMTVIPTYYIQIIFLNKVGISKFIK